MYSTLPAAIMKPDTLCSIYKSLKMLSQHNIVLLASVFYLGKVHIVCIPCVLALHKMCVESWLSYPTISQRSCHVQHYVQPKCSYTLCVQYPRVSRWFSHHDIVLKVSVFYLGKVHIVCIPCVLALHKMCVESRVFYPTISKRSCHVQHTTCRQNAAGHYIFNIQEFQKAFTTLHCTVSKCILLEKSAYSVHTVCSCIAQNVR